MLKTFTHPPCSGVRHVAGFVLGAALLCGFATFQKLAIAAPLSPGGYVVPFLFGGFTGITLGGWYQKMTATNQQLRESRENLEKIVQDRTRHLEQALSEIKTLEGLVPICSYCNKIRDEKGDWSRLEAYFERKTKVRFSHSICTDCISEHHPDHQAWSAARGLG